MPKIILTVPDTSHSVTRPIVYDLTRQIFAMTGLAENTTIFYPDDMERAVQPGSTLEYKGDVNTAPFSTKVTVEVEEGYEQERILSSAVNRPENLHIFRDDRIETYIKPTYSSTDMVLSFHYRAVDKNTAVRWRDDIKTRISMMRDVRIHDVSYYYLIPPEFLVILKEIHRMRELVDGYGETYDEYFKANVTQRASILTTLIGTHGMWGISESQMRIVGYFDWDGAPEQGTKEDEGDTWTISFRYKFKYDKPVACVMHYPLVIHNQVIEKYRPDKPVDTVDVHVRSYALSAANFHEFEKGVKLVGIPQGVALPSYDEFIPGNVLPHTLRVFTALVTIDTENDPSVLMSLAELGDIELHPDIRTFLISEVPYLTKPRLSLFGIQLYRNTDLMPNNALTVLPDLTVTTNEELSLREYHHVRLSLATDLTELTSDSLDRARNHGRALRMILDSLDPTLLDKGLMPPLLGPNYVTKAALDAAIREMTRVNRAKGDNQIRQFNTVMNLLIAANSRL